jgi:hypothetical protein
VTGDFNDYQEAAKGFGEPAVPGRHLPIEWWKDIRPDLTVPTFVKHLLGYGACSMLFGETGSAKTFLVIHLALCISLGWKFFGRKVRQGLVVYIAAEGGTSVRQRIGAFRQHHGLSYEDDVPFALIAAPVNLLDPEVDLAALIAEIQAAAAKRPEMPLLLVIVETLSRAFAGGNENAPDDMGAFIRNIDRLRAETNAHVLIVHHTGKTASQGARGHSLLRAAVDTEIEVVRSEAMNLSTATVTKQRDEKSGAAFAFRLHVVELGYDDDGDPITSCVLEPLETPAEAPKKSRRERQLPPEYLRAIDSLHNTVAEVGQPLNRSDYPNLKAVTLDQWREELQRRGLYEPGPTGRSRFLRMKERLIDEKLITIDGDLVWPVPRPHTVVPFPGGDNG